MGNVIFRYRYILVMRKHLRNIILNILGVFSKPKPGIHVINSHYVTSDFANQEKDYEIFEEYLKYLQKTSTLIDLETATSRILKKEIPKKELLISLTFDDGFEECYTIIAPLLEKYNCRGAFFINSNYIESDCDYQLEFHNRATSKTKKPMSWTQVIDLHERGHLIGSHTLDHTNFAEISIEEINFQLKRNKEILEEKLNYNCEYFAWTYGQLKHMPLNALKITEKYHKYIFSGTNYKQYFSFDGRVLNRRHQEANWPKSHVKYFLSSSKEYNI